MSLRKNVISNLILTSSNILFPLVVFPYITRTLTNTNIGRVFFIDAFTQYFIIFSSIGIPFYGVREIAKVKNDFIKKSNLVIELVTIQFGLSIFYSSLFLVLNFILPALRGNDLLIKIACITIISNSFLIEWFYQGIEDFVYITKRSLIVKALGLGAVLLLVKHGGDFVVYYLIMASIVLVNAIFNFINFFKNHYNKTSVEALLFKKHMKPLLVLFSINISLSIYTVLDTIILGMLTDPKSVSYYNVPLKVAKVYWMVVGGIGTVLIPKMSALVKSEDTVAITNLLSKSFNVVFLLTLPFCFFCIFFPKEILVLISGEKYIDAVNAIRILSIVPLIIGVCNIYGTQFLLPLGHEKQVLHATIVGLIVSLSLNFILIPYVSYIGSAIACVVAELAVCIYVYLSAKKFVKVVIDSSLVYTILSSLAMCLLYIWSTNYFLSSNVLLFSSIFVYLSSLLFLQIVVFKNEFLFTIIKIGKPKYEN